MLSHGWCCSQAMAQGYASDGGRRAARRDQRQFTPTRPRPFRFEERSANKPKSIMQVRRVVVWWGDESGCVPVGVYLVKSIMQVRGVAG